MLIMIIVNYRSTSSFSLSVVLISLIIWAGTNFPLQDNGSEEYNISESYAGQIGKVFEPATKPMGLDWRGGVGILTSFAAREVFVSTLAILYQHDNDDEDQQTANLLAGLPNATFDGTDQKIFTPSTICGLTSYL